MLKEFSPKSNEKSVEKFEKENERTAFAFFFYLKNFFKFTIIIICLCILERSSGCLVENGSAYRLDDYLGCRRNPDVNLNLGLGECLVAWNEVGEFKST